MGASSRSLLVLLVLRCMQATAMAAAPVWVEMHQGQTYVAAGSCAELKAAEADLLGWMKRVGEVGKVGNCECHSPGACRIAVREAIPAKLRALQGAYPKRSGPNCFNTAMFATGLAKQSVYMERSELSFLLEKGCREKQPDEHAHPGDTVVFLEKTWLGLGQSPIHAYTYVSEELAFSKNGWSNLSAFELQNAQTLAVYYEVDPACLPTGRAPLPAKCRQQVALYDCGAQPRWAADQTCEPAHLYITQELDVVECQAAAYQMDGIPLDSGQRDSLETTLMALDAVATKRIYAKPKEERDFWESVQQRARSLMSGF